MSKIIVNSTSDDDQEETDITLSHPKITRIVKIDVHDSSDTTSKIPPSATTEQPDYDIEIVESPDADTIPPTPHTSLKIFTRCLFVLFCCSAVALCGYSLAFRLISLRQFAILIGVSVFLVIIFGFFSFRRKPAPVSRIFCSLFMILTSIIFILPVILLSLTIQFLDSNQAKGYQTESYDVLVASDSDSNTLNDLADHTQGTYLSLFTGYDTALSQLNSTLTSTPVPQPNYLTSIEAVINHDIDFTLVNTAFRPLISTQLPNFTSQTRSLTTINIDKYPTYTWRPVDTATTPFNILFVNTTSLDDITTTAPSNFISILTVNPTTRQLLITNIPSGTYLNIDGNPDISDTLTNINLYDIGTTAKALSAQLDIDFNYYIHTNSRTIANLIDALDGIPIHSDTYLVTEDKSAPYLCTFHKNITEKENGLCAIAFARERQAYPDGEAHRLANQSQVASTLINKLFSPQSLLYYPKVLTATNGHLETNLSSTTFLDFIRPNLHSPQSWTLSSSTLESTPDIAPLYSLPDIDPQDNDVFYVLKPTAESIANTKNQITITMNPQ